MHPTVLIVARHGSRWGVSADGEVLAVAGTKREAAALARSAAGILRESGADTDVRVAPEAKSFSED